MRERYENRKSEQEKLRLVKEYIEGRYTTEAFIVKNNLNKSTFSAWVLRYKRENNIAVMPYRTHNYPQEFIRRVIDDIVTNKKPIAAASREYLIESKTIYKWLDKANTKVENKPNRYYDSAMKIAICKGYLDQHKQVHKLAMEYDAPENMIYRWIRLYRHGGEKAFPAIIAQVAEISKKPTGKAKPILKTRDNNGYTPEFKLMVAIHGMIAEKSQTKIAQEMGINQPLVSEWKRILEIHGPKIFDAYYLQQEISINIIEKKTKKESSWEPAYMILMLLLIVGIIFIVKLVVEMY